LLNLSYAKRSNLHEPHFRRSFLTMRQRYMQPTVTRQAIAMMNPSSMSCLLSCDFLQQ
jgi:hypothetical protein